MILLDTIKFNQSMISKGDSFMSNPLSSLTRQELIDIIEGVIYDARCHGDDVHADTLQAELNVFNESMEDVYND